MKTEIQGKVNQVLEYIKETQQRTGRSPSYREISHHCGEIGLASAHRYVNYLLAQGLIDKDECGGIAIPSNLKPGKLIKASLVGSVACGEPITALENIENTYELPSHLFGDGETYLLKAQGDSMIEEGIESGDILVVKSDAGYSMGDLVIALIDDEATAKRIYKGENGKFVLHPANKKMQDIIVDSRKELKIRGRVVNVIKNIKRCKEKS